MPVAPDLCPHGPQVEASEPQDVVVYDQSTRDASVLAADSFLSILLSKLDGCFDSVAILTGECNRGPCQGTLSSLPLPHCPFGWDGGVQGGQCLLGQWGDQHL